jgi:hypothetical protein
MLTGYIEMFDSYFLEGTHSLAQYSGRVKRIYLELLVSLCNLLRKITYPLCALESSCTKFKY